jgi:hypothetical protein
MPGSALVAATDAVAVGVTVLATLVVAGLVLSVVYLLKAVREMRREAEALVRESRHVMGELGATVRSAEREVERVERLVGSAEAISEAVGSASRLVGTAVAGPFIKLVAFGSGLARGVRILRRGSPERTREKAVSRGGRRRRSRARRTSREAPRARAR